jgi:hypothetical protein
VQFQLSRLLLNIGKKFYASSIDSLEVIVLKAQHFGHRGYFEWILRLGLLLLRLSFERKILFSDDIQLRAGSFKKRLSVLKSMSILNHNTRKGKTLKSSCCPL